ncbi:hypothetical protein CC80DRAFT_487902 [Byssothecium circinans]|uniref:Uncharacterized protein n=1 Tax=Byssothecium circinans TaxID=147558 RepID=A0A6A5UC14_9PLEO|nr:hypothetical protein CC80DRAFT_487902 [Byssothecium circinans]
MAPSFDVDKNEDPEYVRDIKSEVMVNWLHSKQEERIWTSGQEGEGVFLKKSKGNFVCCPADLESDPSGVYRAISLLNARVAMTVNTRVIKLLLARKDLFYVQIDEGLRLQVIPDISALPFCQKHQSAAFIADTKFLVVWADDPKQLLQRAQYIQDTLMRMIWGGDRAFFEEGAEKRADTPAMEWEQAMEAGSQITLPKRRIMLIQAFCTGATLILLISAMGSGFRQVALQIKIDGNWIRLAFCACVFPQLWLALFFFQVVVGNITQIMGPTGQMKKNTKYYSGKAPLRISRATRKYLPHVTIQMPVFKEGLHAVIEPTIRSIKSAIATYEMQGGTANIFVNDDGMQLIPPEQAKARQDFYDEHNIGWVARPAHNPIPKISGELAFFRRGKFKKASNMNYGMAISARTEEILAQIGRDDEWTDRQEEKAYGQALRAVIQERRGEAWADGNIRIGDYILLIDSDTRVPEDCLLEAVSEMEQSPQVAIIQYVSSVMNVTKSFFEKGITFFTNLIYTQIQYAVANGDVAPFVGHNAVLRWSAMQEIAYDCEMDKREKYWSEETVSEDFDMALRLQTAGYLVRLGAYKNKGFKEGVSLTVYDELARWEKYAYGCNELIFHPLCYWPTRGPFTKLFLRFLTSGMPLPSKCTIIAYIGTYYALGSAWLLTLVNYILVGWYNGLLDKYYIDSFKIYLSIIVVFTVLGNISLAVVRYRMGEGGLLANFGMNLKWIPLLVVFLGGISMHISQALVCHFLSVEMSWEATAKEAENVTFFKEIPRVLSRFKFTFAFTVLASGLMVYMKFFAPPLWRIDLLVAIFPLSAVVASHFLLPIMLNPNLMRFTW